MLRWPLTIRLAAKLKRQQQAKNRRTFCNLINL